MRLSAIVCIMTFFLTILVASLAADAQPPGKISRVGVLGAGFPPSPPARAPFLQVLR